MSGAKSFCKSIIKTNDKAVNQPISILLQTTVPTSEDDWDIKRLKQKIEQPLIKIFVTNYRPFKRRAT